MTLSKRFARCAASAASFLLLALVGCGSENTAEVSGKIQVKGKPPNIPNLMITFMSSKGEVVAGEVALDGAYLVRNVSVGEIRVGFFLAGTGDAVKGTTPTDKADPKTLAKRKMSELRASRQQPQELPLPIRFLDPLKSGLQLTVEPGKTNTYSPDLK